MHGTRYTHVESIVAHVRSTCRRFAYVLLQHLTSHAAYEQGGGPPKRPPRGAFVYTYIYSCVSPYVHGFFFVFTVCSLAIMVPNAHSGGHPKCIPLYKYKNIYLYIFRAKRVSNCYMQRKKKLTVCVCVCPDVRLILVLV